MKDQVKRPNKITIDTHRGKEDTVFGKHSRVPYQVGYLDSKSLIVLAFIDIDQFLDSNFKFGRDRRVIKLDDFVRILGLSKNTVRKCLKDLEKKGIITSSFKNNIGTSYISNILKLHVKYQIITYSFISRPDLSPAVKAFILKVIMLGEHRISNIRNISALVKETGVSRRSINNIMDDLFDRGYILDHPVEKSIQILDVSGIMLDSEEKLLIEHRELREKVAAYEDFPSFEAEIVLLKSEIKRLLRKIDLLQNGPSENNKKT